MGEPGLCHGRTRVRRRARVAALEAENASLRTALQLIADKVFPLSGELRLIARAALADPAPREGQ